MPKPQLPSEDPFKGYWKENFMITRVERFEDYFHVAHIPESFMSDLTMDMAQDFFIGIPLQTFVFLKQNRSYITAWKDRQVMFHLDVCLN